MSVFVHNDLRLPGFIFEREDTNYGRYAEFRVKHPETKLFIEGGVDVTGYLDHNPYFETCRHLLNKLRDKMYMVCHQHEFWEGFRG